MCVWLYPSARMCGSLSTSQTLKTGWYLCPKVYHKGARSFPLPSSLYLPSRALCSGLKILGGGWGLNITPGPPGCRYLEAQRRRVHLWRWGWLGDEKSTRRLGTTRCQTWESPQRPRFLGHCRHLSDQAVRVPLFLRWGGNYLIATPPLWQLD